MPGFVGKYAKVDRLAYQVFGVGFLVVPGQAEKHNKAISYAGGWFAVNGNRGCRCPLEQGSQRG